MSKESKTFWLQAFWIKDANLITDNMGDQEDAEQWLQPGAPWEDYSSLRLT